MEYVLSMQCIYITTHGSLPVVEPPPNILFDLVLAAHPVTRCLCLSMVMASLTLKDLYCVFTIYKDCILTGACCP